MGVKTAVKSTGIYRQTYLSASWVAGEGLPAAASMLTEMRQLTARQARLHGLPRTLARIEMAAVRKLRALGVQVRRIPSGAKSLPIGSDLPAATSGRWRLTLPAQWPARPENAAETAQDAEQVLRLVSHIFGLLPIGIEPKGPQQSDTIRDAIHLGMLAERLQVRSFEKPVQDYRKVQTGSQRGSAKLRSRTKRRRSVLQQNVDAQARLHPQWTKREIAEHLARHPKCDYSASTILRRTTLRRNRK